MASRRPWTVLPHDPIDQLEENLQVVESDLSHTVLRRRMSVVRLHDGRLVFHNAVPLEEPAMAQLERTGVPAFLVVPSAYHRLDVAAFRERYPELKVICPAQCHARVAAVVPVDGHWDALPSSPELRTELLDGSRTGEAALVVTSSGGKVSLLFGDTLFNLPHLPGLSGFVLRLIGSSGGPRVTPLGRLATVDDPGLLAGSLRRLAALPGLARLVPTHGRIVEADAGEVLLQVASSLPRKRLPRGDVRPKVHA